MRAGPCLAEVLLLRRPTASITQQCDGTMNIEGQGPSDFLISFIISYPRSRCNHPCLLVILDFCLRVLYHHCAYTGRCGGTGRRKGFKIPRWQHRTGSIPVSGTTSEQSPLCSDFFFCLRLKRSHLPAPLLLLFRKRSRSARCRYQPFAGSAIQSDHVRQIKTASRKTGCFYLVPPAGGLSASLK